VFGLFFTLMGTYVILQCMLLYLPFTYPQYAASLFAANDFARSGLAAAAVMFSRPMFINLGIDWGVSLLGFATIVCIFLLYLLYWKGAALGRGVSLLLSKSLLDERCWVD
jgi:MFS transporter, DHA1 family, multidrug resistance protein